MFDHLLKPGTLNQAVINQRWSWLVRADTDMGTINSWDPLLQRNHRVLVPVDLQAYAVPKGHRERRVPLTGGPRDPAPFSRGETPPTGIHLHWAMPDALLKGEESSEGGELEMPHLPDRWVVIRALFPNGIKRPLIRGWVIDAATGSVTPLNEFDGTPLENTDLPRLDPLDGMVGGSPLWTASYAASINRFAFHDPLDDLDQLKKVATRGFHGNTATYVVAGWASDPTRDPLFKMGSMDLFHRLEELGWHLDPEADPSGSQPDLPALSRLMETGLFQQPQEILTTQILTRGKTKRYTHAEVAPRLAIPVDNPSKVVITHGQLRFLSLLHGMVTGVPIDRLPRGVDDRPSSTGLSVAMGFDTDDIVSALGADTLAPGPDQRRGAEMLAAAFTSDLMDRLGSQDGLRDIAEREHSDAFRSMPGPPLAAAQPDHLYSENAAPVSPLSVGRKGRAAAAEKKDPPPAPRAKWRDGIRIPEADAPPTPATAPKTDKEKAMEEPGGRIVERPAPRIFIPQAPMLAVKGARPSLRHHHDGLFDDEGRLRCRFSNEAIQDIKGVVTGRDLIPSLGSGALPSEVLTVVREALILNPYCSQWLARAAAPQAEALAPAHARIQAELVRLFSQDGRYDGMGGYSLAAAAGGPHGPRATARMDWQEAAEIQAPQAKQAAAELARVSCLTGLAPSPVGVTAWRQPWVPLWLEWQVGLEGTTTMDAWELTDLELAPREGTVPDKTLDISGRSPVGRGLTHALHGAMERWIQAEQEREATEAVLTPEQQTSLAGLADFMEPLDLASASLDGIREQLLGLDYCGGIHTPDALDDRPVASALPSPLFGGRLELKRLRLVDAFGRTLTIPLGTVATTTVLEIPGRPRSMAMAARLQNGARWLFRLVDPAFQGDPPASPEAFVNQVKPELAVNPVAGFLLPDHIDESLELFDREGAPLGQISHEEITPGVRWEPAPGRELPPGAGPLADLPPWAMVLGKLAAGVVRQDIRSRALATPPADSALTALLRAVDTTLWTVDTYAALGSASVAGLVGRPIAVVKATLKLDIPHDLDQVRITEAGGETARQQAFDDLKDQAFPVRLGDLQRSDDALLGFYVDEDYDHFHLVDKVVAALAREGGRHRGQLGLLGQTPVPEVVPLSHPLLTLEDTLYIRPGQTRSLTLLMLPAGRVHLTSGILPRKALTLSDSWVGPGLNRIMPSVRVGPVLVDPEEIRLPKVHILGDKQQFTRRTGPLTWRDDPIISATQSALLPRMPHEFQEGWVRLINGDK